MTDQTNTPTTAPKEIDTTALDQVVGAGVAMPEARKQEQSDKLRGEELEKRSSK